MRTDVFWDLNITFKYFLGLKKSQQQCTFFKLEIISDKSRYQKCNYLEITLLMCNLLKHANYLNTVMKSRNTYPGVRRLSIRTVRERKERKTSGEPCMKCSSHVTI